MRIAASIILAYSLTLMTHSERTETSEDVPLLQASRGWPYGEDYSPSYTPSYYGEDYSPSYTPSYTKSMAPSGKATFERKRHPSMRLLLEDKDLALTHAQQEVLKGQFEHSVPLEDKDVLQARPPSVDGGHLERHLERAYRPLRMLLEDKDLALTRAQQEVLKGQFEHSVLLEDKDVPSGGFRGNRNERIRNARLLEDKDLALSEDAPLMQLS